MALYWVHIDKILFVVSPLNAVPRKEADERRIILDLSFPKGSSINDFVSKDFYLGDRVNLTYLEVDDLVEIIKRIGQGCLLFKRDLARAYRLIVLDLGDVSLVGYSFKVSFYFDKVLSMGLRSAAHIAQRTTNSISFICNTLDISIVNYLDDFADADTVEKARRSFIELGNILLDMSLHKAYGPSVEMCFIGVLFNTETLGRAKRIWYLSPMRAAKVQASLRIRAVSPEPSLLAHTSSESRGTFRQKARSLAPLNGWACAVKMCHDGMLEDTNSLVAAHLDLENYTRNIKRTTFTSAIMARKRSSYAQGAAVAFRQA